MMGCTKVNDTTTGVKNTLELHTPSIDLLPHLHSLGVLRSLYVVSNDDINVSTNDHTGDTIGNYRGILGGNRTGTNIEPECTISITYLSVGDQVVELRDGLNELTA